MFRCVSLVLSRGFHKSPAMQVLQRLLHRALGQTGLLGDLAMTQPRAGLALAVRATPQEQVHKEGCRRAIVTGEIAKQHIHDVGIESE